MRGSEHFSRTQLKKKKGRTCNPCKKNLIKSDAAQEQGNGAKSENGSSGSSGSSAMSESSGETQDSSDSESEESSDDCSDDSDEQQLDSGDSAGDELQSDPGNDTKSTDSSKPKRGADCRCSEIKTQPIARSRKLNASYAASLADPFGCRTPPVYKPHAPARKARVTPTFEPPQSPRAYSTAESCGNGAAAASEPLHSKAQSPPD